MVQLGQRFTDYGITGAYYWIAQTIVLTVYGSNTRQSHWLVNWLGGLTHPLGQVPAYLQPTATALLAAFSVIGIFVAGLVLDLIPSPLILVDVAVLKKHIERHRAWMKVIFAKREDTYADHFDYFSQTWPPRTWIKLFKMRERFAEFWSFLLQYTYIYSGSPNFDSLNQQAQTWRTAKAVSKATAFITVQIFVFSIVDWHLALLSFRDVLISLVTGIALLGGAIYISLSTFNGLCYELFSLALLSSEKEASAELAESVSTEEPAAWSRTVRRLFGL